MSTTLQKERQRATLFFLSALVVVFFLFIALVHTFVTPINAHYGYLAESFLQGRLDFIRQPHSWNDTTIFEGRHYWPLGPFPAVLLMPFVAFAQYLGAFFYEGTIQILLVAGVFFFCFVLARRFGYAREDALYWAIAFSFASAFLGVAAVPFSWYFAHVVAAFFLLAALVEYVGQRRSWLIGIFMGIVVATRITAGIGIVFFLLEVFLGERLDIRAKVRRLGGLLIPFGIVLALLGAYNVARFGSIFEQGYTNQLLSHSGLEEARSYGLTGFVHLPGNLYYLLLSTPLPVFRSDGPPILVFPFITANPWGMSIFVTSPYLLYLFFLRYRDRLSKILWLTVGMIAFPLLLFYASGFFQFAGSRYTLDFLPFIFVLLMRNYHVQHKALSIGMRCVILFTACVNFYLFVGQMGS